MRVRGLELIGIGTFFKTELNCSSYNIFLNIYIYIYIYKSRFIINVHKFIIYFGWFRSTQFFFFFFFLNFITKNEPKIFNLFKFN